MLRVSLSKRLDLLVLLYSRKASRLAEDVSASAVYVLRDPSSVSLSSLFVTFYVLLYPLSPSPSIHKVSTVSLSLVLSFYRAIVRHPLADLSIILLAFSLLSSLPGRLFQTVSSRARREGQRERVFLRERLCNRNLGYPRLTSATSTNFEETLPVRWLVRNFVTPFLRRSLVLVTPVNRLRNISVARISYFVVVQGIIDFVCYFTYQKLI